MGQRVNGVSGSGRPQFAALESLRLGPTVGQLPHVQTSTVTDCGAACLTSVLRYYGKHVELREVRDACGSGERGTSALMLIQVARHFGLRGRAVSVDMDTLPTLPRGTILFWGFNHFVVLDRVKRTRLDVIDPSRGRRPVPRDEYGRMFTGVALLFEKTEKFATNQRGSPRSWVYIRRILANRGLLSRILVTSGLLQLFGVGLPLLTGAVVDRVVPLEDIGLLQVLAAGTFVASGSYCLTSLVRSHLVLHLRTELDAKMTLDFLDHLVRLPYTFFQRRSAGDLMMRLNSNSTVREILTSSALSGALDGVLVFTYLIALFVANAAMGAIVLLFGVLRVAIFAATKGKVRDLMAENLTKQATSQAFQIQMFAGMETLKASGAEARAVEKWSHLFVDWLNVALRQGRLGAGIQAASDGLAYLAPLAILLCGAMLVIDGRLTLGGMLALSALGIGFLLPLANLIGTAARLQELSSYTERLDDVLETTPEQQGNSSQRPLALQGGVVLEGVTFSHSPNLPASVQGVSLSISAGQRVAVVGRSGAGKSTLVKLLTGLYVPDTGRILYDGVDLRTLELCGVREQIGTVMQHTYLFSGSIRDNIALGRPEASLSEVMQAAKLAQIHEVVMAMPMQYDCYVSAGGLSLSGGERQRIALARALVNRPAILVLDEATSEVDVETERLIQESLATLECTQIIIAHRLTTVVTADEIIVLDNGRIVEKGSHRGLAAQDGYYAQLLASQASMEAR